MKYIINWNITNREERGYLSGNQLGGLIMKKKLLGLMFVTALSIGTVASVGAASWTTGVQFVNIPGGGNEKTNYNKPNTKSSSTQIASFYCKKRTAVLANNARVVNSDGDLRSSWTGISENKLTKANETNAKSGYYLYARVKSHSIEWGNNNDVTLDFSADNASK